MFKMFLTVLVIVTYNQPATSNDDVNAAIEKKPPIYFFWDSVVYGWHANTNEPYSVWESKSEISKIEHNGAELIAVQEFEERTNHHGYKILRIITEDGVLVTTLREEHAVQEFCWSPTGREIAFTLGDYVEASQYEHKGIYVYNISTKEITQLGESGYYLNWAHFDDKLYYNKLGDEYGIYAYDLIAKEETKTNYKGSVFNGNGKYYIIHPYLYDASGIYLYERASNKLITELPESPVPGLNPTELTWVPIKWINDRQLSLVSTIGKSKYYLLNVETGHIRKQQNPILQEYSSGIVVVRKPDRSLALEEIESMPEVKPEDLPKTWDELRAEREAASKTAAP